MSYANGTTHYNLPQTVGSDKRDWSDTNQAFADLDAAVYEASAGLSGYKEKISELESATSVNTTAIANNEDEISTNAANILTNKQDITALKTTVDSNYNTVSTEVADIKQDSQDMITSNNEASATSTHSYAVGDYFIYNDVLYKATNAIAVGDTIVPNTNCEATNVGTELQSVEGADVTELTEKVDTIEGNVTTVQADVTNLQKRASDTEGYITSYYENDEVADNDYAVDDFVVFDNKLHKVTSAITTGDTFEVGVNCEETTIAEQLKREDMFSVELPVESGETWGTYLQRIAPTVYNLTTNSGKLPLCKLEVYTSAIDDYLYATVSKCTNTETYPQLTQFSAVAGSIATGKQSEFYAYSYVMSTQSNLCSYTFLHITETGSVAHDETSLTAAKTILYY